MTTLVVLVGCSEAQPCTSCPAVDGTYAVTWADGGGVTTTECTLQGPRPPTWTFGQRGTNVTTAIEQVPIGGTYFDSYDMILSGGENGVTYRLRALAIPGGGVSDAGMDLRGSLTSRKVDDATGDLCEVTDSFTAQRTSR